MNSDTEATPPGNQSVDPLYHFALGHARKRLRLDDSHDPTHVLNSLIDSAVGGPSTGSMGGPSATAQLMALLAASINGRPSVLRANDADEIPSEDEAATLQAAVPRAILVTWCTSELEPSLLARATDATQLPGAVNDVLALGANVNACDADGNSPLWLALHIPNSRAALSVMHNLLRRGADPNTRRHGSSLLSHALSLRRTAIVQRLLRDGAVPHKSGGVSRLPHEGLLSTFAAAHGFEEEAKKHMRRGLIFAARQGDCRAVRGWLQYGCPPDHQLMIELVRQRADPSLVSALLACGADPNATDRGGTHPLTIASLHGDVYTARALLASGADPHALEDNISILTLAKQHCAPATLIALMEQTVPNSRKEGTATSTAFMERRGKRSKGHMSL